MKEIRCEYFERSGKELRSRVGRRFQVLPEHEAPFQRELNGLQALYSLVKRFEHTPWYFRLVMASIAVFRAQWFIDRRHHTWRQTFVFAMKASIVFSSPDWLQERLSKKWGRDMRQEKADRLATAQGGQGVPATNSPLRCGEPSRGLS